MFLDKDVDASKAEGLFKEVKYYVTGEICEKVQELLSRGEAKKTSYLSGLNTHCIVGSEPDMNEVSEATDMLDVPSVDQEWVVASCLVGQLLPIQPFSPAEGRLMAGVVACLGELPGEDQAKVWAMLTWHGGRVVTSLSPEVGRGV